MRKLYRTVLFGAVCVVGLAAGEALAGFSGTDVFLPMVGRNVGV